MGCPQLQIEPSFLSYGLDSMNTRSCNGWTSNFFSISMIDAFKMANLSGFGIRDSGCGEDYADQRHLEHYDLLLLTKYLFFLFI